MTNTEINSPMTDDESKAGGPSQAPDETIAALYEFCAGVIADPPDGEAVERLLDAPLPGSRDVPNESLEQGFERLDAWRRSVDDPDAEAERLAVEHTRLFVGPRPALQVHESYYADEYLGEPLARVRGTYDAVDIDPADGLREEADHAAVELSALATLSRRKTETDDATPSDTAFFLQEHGWWLPALADDLEEASDGRFYAGVAALVAGLVRLDAERRGVSLERPPD